MTLKEIITVWEARMIRFILLLLLLAGWMIGSSRDLNKIQPAPEPPVQVSVPAGRPALALESTDIYWARRNAADADTLKTLLRRCLAVWERGKVSDADKQRARAMAHGDTSMESIYRFVRRETKGVKP